MRKIIDKYKEVPLVVKAAFWFTFASMMQKSLSFITVPIFTRIMETEQYGIYSTYLSWTSIITVFLTLNMDAGAYSNVLGKEGTEEEKADITISYITLCASITTIALILILLFAKPISAFSGMPVSLIFLMIMEIYAIPVARFWTFQQRFRYRYRSLIGFTMLKSIANVCLGLFLVSLAAPEYQAQGRIMSIVIVESISALILYLGFVKNSGRFFLVKRWAETIKFQLPLIPHYLSMNFLLSSDRIMIQRMVGASEAGIYSVAYSAGQLMTIFKTCIADALRPWLYNKLNKNDHKSISHLISILSFSVAFISIGFSIIAPELISIMAAPQYHAAIYVIPPVAISSLFTFIYQILLIVETYYGKTTKIMYASIYSAVVNIILNYLLIPIGGYIVAGYTTLISYILLSIFHYRTVNEIQRNELHGAVIFDVKNLMIMSGFSIFLCIMVSFLYDYTVLRYCLVIVFAVIMIVSRKNIIRIYKWIKE